MTKFRITYFAGDTAEGCCHFNIIGPELSRQRFGVVHKDIESLLDTMNIEMERAEAAKGKEK